jgi:hypothetical protein
MIVPAALALVLPACNTGNDEGGKFDISVSGAAEKCEDSAKCGGDASGEATIDINSDRNEVCYEIKLEGAEGINAAHIHSGEEGEAGPVVIDLEYEGGDSGGEGCVDGIDEGDLEKVSKDPVKHYLNIHSEQYPDGAARGQLKS